MTTDTVRHAPSPYRRAGVRARGAARDTSTAARHAVLGLRIAGNAPVSWAVAGAHATGRALARAWHGLGRAGRGGARRLPVWWPVAVCTLVGALGGAAYGLLKAPEYTATSYVMVTSADSGGPATVGYAQAYGRIATGGAVLNRARTVSIPLDALESGVEAVTSPDAPMIEITGTSGTPRRAADMANRVAQALTGIANLSSKDTGAELRVFSDALTPDTPASPSLPLSVAVGACTGGLLGALLLLVRPRRAGRGGLETVPAPAAAPAQDGLPHTVSRPEPYTPREVTAGSTRPAKKKETTAPAKKNSKEKVR